MICIPLLSLHDIRDFPASIKTFYSIIFSAAAVFHDFPGNWVIYTISVTWRIYEVHGTQDYINHKATGGSGTGNQSWRRCPQPHYRAILWHSAISFSPRCLLVPLCPFATEARRNAERCKNERNEFLLIFYNAKWWHGQSLEGCRCEPVHSGELPTSSTWSDLSDFVTNFRQIIPGFSFKGKLED